MRSPNKIKIPLGDSLKKETNRTHLKRFFPFLNKEYRKIEKKEIGKIEVLHELFGVQEKDLSKLRTVYEYQNI